MLTATVEVSPELVVAPVRRRTFGSFVEHLGRCVYGGIYEPGHPGADVDGLRTDVLDLVREMGVSVVRYPGGNFVSGYRWEDGVGPVAERPTRLDSAWRSVESNEFGLGEFARWAGRAGVEPMMAVNLGTRGVQEALDLLEYSNHPQGTHLSDRRVADGSAEPFGIRMWCLGNEMDGPWQLGHKTAVEYGRLAAETARAMRMLDRGLELVACGSSGSGMPTFGAWESTVLELAYDQVDHVSAHAYYEYRDGDLDSFLASAVDMDHVIDAVVAIADGVGARLGSTKKIMVSFDEWNVWYQSRMSDWLSKDWATAPRFSEEAYTAVDAVVVGGLLISLLRHSDRVAVACQAQLVNALAPIRAELGGPAWRQTTFHPFALTARHARGEVLRTEIVAPVRETARYGPVPVLDMAVTHDRDEGEVAVFALNRHPDEPLTVSLDARGFDGYQPVGQLTMGGREGLELTNTQEEPDRVRPVPAATAPTVTDGRLRAVLPPASWNLIRLRSGLPG